MHRCSTSGPVFIHLFHYQILYALQRAKKVVSDRPGLVDFARWVVNPVFNLSEGQVFFGGKNSKCRKTVTSDAHENFFGATLKTLGLVHTSNNLPEWQAVKPAFFAPCALTLFFHLSSDCRC